MGSHTMKSVAEALGVSVTSVSNAFNRPDRISQELRRTIIDGAAQLGYHGPDAVGRVLRSGRSNTYGVVFNERLSYAFTDPYAVSLLAGFAEVLEARQRSVTLLPLPADAQASATVVNEAVVDGLMGLCASDQHPGIVAARQRGLPVVLTDVSQLGDHVSVDEVRAGGSVADHLKSLGHRDVAMIYDLPDPVDELHVATTPEAVDQAIEALHVAGFSDAVTRITAVRERFPDLALYASGRNVRENGRRCAQAALAASPRPTAMVAISDVLALGVLDVLDEQGLQPGRDIAVTGFDGIAQGRERGLTTIVQPIVEKGQLAAELLLDPDRPHRKILLDAPLWVGSSTQPD